MLSAKENCEGGGGGGGGGQAGGTGTTGDTGKTGGTGSTGAPGGPGGPGGPPGPTGPKWNSISLNKYKSFSLWTLFYSFFDVSIWSFRKYNKCIFDLKHFQITILDWLV